MSLKRIKISPCQRQLPYVLNSVLLSANTDASLNWFLFNYSLQHHQHFAYVYIHSLLQCNHLEENMWLITSEKIYSFQTNISVNEPPSLLSWHKLCISAVPITQLAGSPEAEQRIIAWLLLFLLFMFLFKSSALLLSCSGLSWLPGLDCNLTGKLFTGNELWDSSSCYGLRHVKAQ